MIKTKLMRIFIYFFKKYFNWNAIQNSFIHKKTFSCEKMYRSFGLTSVLSILQKSKVANNSITILSCSNDKNIYISRRILFLLTGWFSLQVSARSTNRVRPKFKKTKNLKLTLKQAKLQWHKCWRKQEERW